MSPAETAKEAPVLHVRDLWAGYGARPAISGVAFILARA